jgi:hypothetical protein
MVFLGGSREILEFFGVVGGYLVEKRGLLRNLENFRGFLWIFGGFRVVLDLVANIFQKQWALLEFLQTFEDRDKICGKFKGLDIICTGFIEFPNISSTEKPVD